MTRGTFSGNCSVARATMRLDLPVPASPITTTRTADLPARFAATAGAITPAMPRASSSSSSSSLSLSLSLSRHSG
uniref:Uncharacterized protein n=1 Tax=Arundo donax TaxID=35708 RepID=A0A0A9G353_ARUDO